MIKKNRVEDPKNYIRLRIGRPRIKYYFSPRQHGQVKFMKKIEAARELHAIYNSYEVRKVKLATILRKMYKWGDNWRLCGYAHDYTV